MARHVRRTTGDNRVEQESEEGLRSVTVLVVLVVLETVAGQQVTFDSKEMALNSTFYHAVYAQGEMLTLPACDGTGLTANLELIQDTGLSVLTVDTQAPDPGGRAAISKTIIATAAASGVYRCKSESTYSQEALDLAIISVLNWTTVPSQRVRFIPAATGGSQMYLKWCAIGHPLMVLSTNHTPTLHGVDIAFNLTRALLSPGNESVCLGMEMSMATTTGDTEFHVSCAAQYPSSICTGSSASCVQASLPILSPLTSAYFYSATVEGIPQLIFENANTNSTTLSELPFCVSTLNSPAVALLNTNSSVATLRQPGASSISFPNKLLDASDSGLYICIGGTQILVPLVVVHPLRWTSNGFQNSTFTAPNNSDVRQGVFCASGWPSVATSVVINGTTSGYNVTSITFVEGMLITSCSTVTVQGGALVAATGQDSFVLVYTARFTDFQKTWPTAVIPNSIEATTTLAILDDKLVTHPGNTASLSPGNGSTSSSAPSVSSMAVGTMNGISISSMSTTYHGNQSSTNPLHNTTAPVMPSQPSTVGRKKSTASSSAQLYTGLIASGIVIACAAVGGAVYMRRLSLASRQRGSTIRALLRPFDVPYQTADIGNPPKDINNNVAGEAVSLHARAQHTSSHGRGPGPQSALIRSQSAGYSTPAAGVCAWTTDLSNIASNSASAAVEPSNGTYISLNKSQTSPYSLLSQVKKEVVQQQQVPRELLKRQHTSTDYSMPWTPRNNSFSSTATGKKAPRLTPSKLVFDMTEQLAFDGDLAAGYAAQSCHLPEWPEFIPDQETADLAYSEAGGATTLLNSSSSGGLYPTDYSKLGPHLHPATEVYASMDSDYDVYGGAHTNLLYGGTSAADENTTCTLEAGLPVTTFQGTQDAPSLTEVL